MILVLATMGEGRKRGKGKNPLDNFEPHVGLSTYGGKFLEIDATTIDEQTCAALCNEMPKCSGFTFRIGAEEYKKKTSTEAGQCRFKNNIKLGVEDPNRITYIKLVEEEEEEEEV